MRLPLARVLDTGAARLGTGLGTWHRAHPRRSVVTVVVVAGVLALVGIAHWLPIDRAPRAGSADASHMAPLTAPRAVTPATATPPPPSAPRSPAQVADRFALAWAAGDVAGIRSTATPTLARRLDLRPASPTSPTAATVASTTTENVTGEAAGVKVARVLVTLAVGPSDGSASRLPLALTLTRHQRAGQSSIWRVSAVGAT